MRANHAPVPVHGTVYGVVLNDHDSVGRLGSTLQDAPYKAPPKAPVLYIKPANTFSANGASVALPLGAGQVEIGATIGLLMGSTAARLGTESALEAVRGYIVVADLSLPHNSYYRPAILEKCFDGSCVVADAPSGAGLIKDPAALVVQTHINGSLVEQWQLDELVRPVPQLLRDVTQFMTLHSGDILLVGVKWQAATAVPGDTVRVSAQNVGQVEFSIVSEGGEA